MKKTWICLCMAAVLLLGMPFTAAAEHLKGQDNWQVTFTQNKTLETNFDVKNQNHSDEIRGLEPGDDITFTVNLLNDNPNTVDWYMSNEVISTLEKAKAQAIEGADIGGYSYLLTYKGSSSEKTLYDSETIGGTNTEGLMEATNALDEYFFLDTLSYGQTAEINLVVGLDGDTQWNTYMNTLADLKMNFAVELRESNSNNTGTPTPSDNSTRTLVDTGDHTPLMALYFTMGAAGLGFLILAFLSLNQRRRERREGMR